MRIGAYDFITKPTTADQLLATINRALERRQLLIDNILMKDALDRLQGSHEMVGQSDIFRRVLEVAAKVAPTESTVLIQGPSGTGRNSSPISSIGTASVRNNRFVTLNCASIPDTLIESELFGYEKGAFTDAARQKPASWKSPTRVRWFLDEVGDISPIVQPKILRFIQSGEFRRVGGNTALNADVRILSATNKNLKEEVREGRFREDLLYRLNVITIDIPPLRDRKQDIPLLVASFLANRMKTKVQTSISTRAMEVLVDYDWPGISASWRMSSNVLPFSAITHHRAAGFFSPQCTGIGVRIGGAKRSENRYGASLKEIEHLHIEGVLRAFRGNKAESARSWA